MDEKIVQGMADLGTFMKYLGKGEHYSNFLVFFQREIEGKGVEGVLKEYLFSGEEVAERLLVMLFGGMFPLYLSLPLPLSLWGCVLCFEGE